MAHLAVRPDLNGLSRASGPSAASRWLVRLLRIGILVISIVLIVFSMLSGIQRANADSTAYLIEVTVRPGYHFPNAEAALGYGYQLCDRVSHGEDYAGLIGGVKADFQTGDEFQASYLIDKAVNELCPAQIWQLRQSAAHYRPALG